MKTNHKTEEPYLKSVSISQIKSEKEDVYLNTSDFIGPPGSHDHMGMFCCSIFGSVAMAAKYEDAGDDYNSLMVKSLADRLVSKLFLHPYLKLFSSYSIQSFSSIYKLKYLS